MMKIWSDTQYIQKLVAEGEHEQQDFKFEISDARKIARSISAFANTQGGRLLVGIKDNGKIAGIRFEEEIYMIEAAADLYCQPQAVLETQTHIVEGRTILEVNIQEATIKPIYALDEDNKPRAYIRIKDENIMATPVHLKMWQQNKKKEGTFVAYTEKEQQLIQLLKAKGKLTLNQCCRLCRMDRKIICSLLADFTRFGVVTTQFESHKFYFKLNEE